MVSTGPAGVQSLWLWKRPVLLQLSHSLVVEAITSLRHDSWDLVRKSCLNEALEAHSLVPGGGFSSERAVHIRLGCVRIGPMFKLRPATLLVVHRKQRWTIIGLTVESRSTD